MHGTILLKYRATELKAFIYFRKTSKIGFL